MPRRGRGGAEREREGEGVKPRARGERTSRQDGGHDGEQGRTSMLSLVLTASALASSFTRRSGLQNTEQKQRRMSEATRGNGYGQG